MNASEIKTATTAELVAYYNKLTGKSIKKFQDRATAEKRVAAEVKSRRLCSVVAEIDALSSKAELSVVTFGDGKKMEFKEPAEKPKPATGPRKVGLPGPNSKLAGKRLFKKVTTNPRRPGTAGHTSFSVIRDGMSYEEYRLKGGRSNDLAWDIKHDYVEVK